MQIQLNGKQCELATQSISVADFLKARGIEPLTVAVELNMVILDKQAYASTTLKANDVLEVVRFVGGGI